jgi:hypothetical protein
MKHQRRGEKCILRSFIWTFVQVLLRRIVTDVETGHTCDKYLVNRYAHIIFHKNTKRIEHLGDTDMGEMIILKLVLKAIGCEGVVCTDVAGNTVQLWKLINPAINFGVFRKTWGSSALTQPTDFIFHGASSFLCL